jgi:hypothetical protein
MFASNRAPEFLWHSQALPCGTRRDRLWIDGQQTPYFIDSTEVVRHRIARGSNEPHALFGSGQGAPSINGTRGAAVIATGAAIERLMHRAEQLATA